MRSHFSSAHRTVLLVTLLGAGCAPEGGERMRRPGFDADTADTGEPTDTGSPGDTGSQDTAVPDPTGEACYPGPSNDGALCLPLVSPEDPGPEYDYPAPYQGSASYRAPVAYLDLDALDPALDLAPNFRLGEVAQASKGRYAVVQPHAIAAIQGLRDVLGPLGVNSGYRSPGYNAGVPGSATWSRHMYGDAFDLGPTEVSLDALQAACEDAGAGYVGVYTTHIHCDWRDDALHSGFFGAARAAAWAEPPAHDAWIVWEGGSLRAPAVGWDEGEPLREWWAYDDAGTLVDNAIGPTYVPPAEADRVVVEVGRAVVRSIVTFAP